jgi:hypothetical protein
MPMVGEFFVGFVNCGHLHYWNDEIRQVMRNAYNREVMNDEEYCASKLEHDINVRRTVARDKVVAIVNEAKLRAQREEIATSDAVDAAAHFAEASMSIRYKHFFDAMGLEWVSSAMRKTQHACQKLRRCLNQR